MYTGNTVSYRAIMDKQLRDFGFDIDDESGLEWLAEFMAHTKVGMVMKQEVAYLKVQDGRADLPFDLFKLIQTACLTDVKNLEEAKCGKGVKKPMRWSTDNFHTDYHKDGRDYTSQSLDTYTVGQGFIFPSFNTGFLAIAYEAIPTDEEGNPLIPADQSWLEAASHYIAFKEARKRWLRDALTDKKYQIIERDKEWYFAQAVNTKFPQNVDQMESMKNSTVETIPDIQSHSSFFANMQLPEQRKFRGKNTTSTVPNNVYKSKYS